MQQQQQQQQQLDGIQQQLANMETMLMMGALPMPAADAEELGWEAAQEQSQLEF